MALTLEGLTAALTADPRQSWSAGDTGVTLPESSGEPTMALGLNISTVEAQQLRTASSTASFAEASMPPPPPLVDWRTSGIVTAIKRQGACGSCVAFAACAVMESRHIQAHSASGVVATGIDLSEAHLFYCGCGGCCARGWQFTAALDVARTQGVCLEADFPYVPQNTPCRPGVQPAVRVTRYAVHYAPDQRKRAVARGPVIAGMRVYEDLTFYKGGVYSHVAGAFRGNHAVAVIGYDDRDKSWLVKNSWGPGWGDAGYFRLAYRQCELDGEFPFFEIDVH